MTNDTNTTELQQAQNSTRNIFRTRKTTQFVTISTIPLYDPNLSLKAKGLWAFGMAHPNDWTFYFSELETHCKEGKTAIYNAFNELIEAGYAARFAYKEKMPNSNRWVFAGNEYIFFESKHTKEQVSAVKEEFKKCFPQRGFLDAHFEDPQNPQLLEHDGLLEHDSLKEYAPPDGDAKPPPSSLSDATKGKPSKVPKAPFRTVNLKERMPNHPQAERFKNYFNSPLVGIDDQDHQELIAQHGEKVVLDAYECLANWKLSKAETKPKVIGEHTDLARLKKWAIKEVKDNPTAVKGLGSHRAKWAIEADSKPLPEIAKRPYAWGMKSDEREKELMEYLTKVKKQNTRLGRMSIGMVDDLEKEMLEYLKAKGVEHVVDSL